MTYRKLYEDALYKLEHNKITLGEFEEMIKPLEREVEQEPCDMTAEQYRQRMMKAFHNADCSELIALCVLPTEKEFKHLEWLLKKEWRKEQEPCLNESELNKVKQDFNQDAISRQVVLDKIQRLIDAEGNCHDENGNYLSYAQERVNSYEAIQQFVECDFLCPPVQPKANWIPASEKLPDTDDKVLCWYEYYHWSQEKVLPEYEIGRYFKETSEWFGEVANGKDVRVIAWMPLPKPYVVEEQGETE